ncbi:hypothetical protein FJZ48_01275 [Candidatus Uhrbacteria bacterium]|nr:hypothetical protein [Candidatus Uhrbacteria bacterium]
MCKVWKVAIPIFLCFCIFYSFAYQAHAIGLTPPQVSVGNVLRNTTYNASVRISKTPEEKDTELHLGVAFGGDYGNVLSGNKEVVIPADAESIEYPFTIQAKNLASGNYAASITFSYKPQNTELDRAEKGAASAYVGIVIGARILVTFNVNEEEIKGIQLISIGVQDTETDDPVRVQFVVKNIGNVIWKADRIDIDFQDTADTNTLVTSTVSHDQFPLVSPGQVENLQLVTSKSLPIGQYRARGKIFDASGALLGEMESQPFSVYRPDTLKKNGEMGKIQVPKQHYKTGEFIKVAVLFTNTGQVALNGFSVIEIFRENILVGTQRSKERMIEKGETISLEKIINLQEPGTYRLVAYVDYDVKRTPSDSVTIEIVNPVGSFLPWLMIIVVCILALILVLLVKRMRKPPSAPPLQESSQEMQQIAQKGGDEH